MAGIKVLIRQKLLVFTKNLKKCDLSDIIRYKFFRRVLVLF